MAVASQDHMQIICTELQTDSHASTPSLNFLRAGCSSWRPTFSNNHIPSNLYNKNDSQHGVDMIVVHHLCDRSMPLINVMLASASPDHVCGTLRHRLCDKTLALDSSSNNWKHRIVTVDFRVLEILLLTYLHASTVQPPPVKFDHCKLQSNQ